MKQDDPLLRLAASLEESAVLAARNRQGSAKLLRGVASSLRRGILPSPLVCEWLAEALEAVANGEDAGRALGVTLRRKRPAGNFATRDWNIFIEVERLMSAQPLKSGRDSAGVYETVAETFSLSARQVERVFQSESKRFAALAAAVNKSSR